MTDMINTDGWHDIISWLPVNLGARLAMLASGGRAPAFAGKVPSEWSADVSRAADALIRYGAVVRVGDPPDPATIEGAREALRWVADNLEHLWH